MPGLLPEPTSVRWSFMSATMPVAPAGPKPARSHKKRPLHWCRRCPYRGPWGQCFDLRRKSGRCGDWVWYLRDGKQRRRLYAKPRDPRTPAQRYWRAKFGAASSKYSHSLTQEERRACILAGSKLRSRPRLAQSGPLKGQHYSIRRDYATPAAVRPRDAKSSTNPLQTKGISLSTSERYRTSAGPLSQQHACPTRRAGHNQPARTPRIPARQRVSAVSTRMRSRTGHRVRVAVKRTIPLAVPPSRG
jgi:hypothetical protein